MPRTTRTRAASRRGEASMPSSDPATIPSVPVANTANVALPPPPPPPEEDDIYGVSDRELERQRKAKKEAAASTTSERPEGRGMRSRTSAADAAALQASRRRRDAAMDRLDDLTSTNDDSSQQVELGRRGAAMEDSSLLGGPHRGNLPGLEIHDDEIFGNLDSSFNMSADADGTAQQHSGSSHGTRSADTSVFNVSVFRRQQPPRARQRRRSSSIVGKDDAPIRPSSRGPTTPGLSSTFSLGNFKRRPRQPSILMSSAQKASLGLQRSRAASAVSGDENAVESEAEEESFLPEAEGTPVRLSRGRKSAAEENVAAEPGPALEPAPQAEVEGGRETRSRKRKSGQGHGGEAAKRQAVEAEEEALHESIEVDDRSSPPSFIERRRRATLELDEDILAPPASSSSREGSPTIWPSLKDLGKKHHKAPPRARKATPAVDDHMSDISEPPSLTHSPNFKATKPASKSKRKESPKLSTADLEALLPRRRRRVRRGEHDLEDEDSNTSEQELPPRVAKKKPAKPLKDSSKTNHSHQAKEATAPTKRTTRRTYGSRRFDKENTAEGESIEVGGETSPPLDDTAFEADVNDETTTTLGLGNELKAASRKFKEVDQWELDFEEVVEPSSDLPEGR